MRQRFYVANYMLEYGRASALTLFINGLEYLQWVIGDPASEASLRDEMEKVRQDPGYNSGRLRYDVFVDVYIKGSETIFIEQRTEDQLEQHCSTDELLAIIQEMDKYQKEYATAYSDGSPWRGIKTQLDNEDLAQPFDTLAVYYDPITQQVGLFRDLPQGKEWYARIKPAYGDVTRPAKAVLKEV